MYFRDPSTESTNAELFFAPLPQHTDSPSPESFEQEFTRLDLHLPFEQYDNFLPAFHDSIPDISPPSAYPNHSGHKVTSHHSSDFTQSDHSIPSDSLLNNGFYGTIHSPDFSNGLPPIQPLHTAGAQFGFETSNLGLNVGISPGDLSTAMQVPAAAAAHMTPNSEIQMQIGPGPDRPYQCPICPHTSKRKHNMKTHIETHNKSKPFECGTCGYRFSRKNDLHRHCKNPSTHRKQIATYDDSKPPTSA